MERTQSHNPPSRVERQLAHLKIISRLLSHELHAQTGPRVMLSREELDEVRTSIDLFIEEFVKKKGHAAVPADLEVQAVPARIN